MAGLRTADLEGLRLKVAALEKRPLLGTSPGDDTAGGDTNHDAPGRTAAHQAFGLLSAPAGLLHEIFTDEPRNAGAALGFTLGLAAGLLSPARPAILCLQLVAQTRELGLPYGIGLSHFGLDPDAVVIGRIGTIAELLWAMEEAIACRAVAAVVADLAEAPKILDFTASRRLSLRAAASGTSALITRYGRAREASAAKLRWRVNPALSGPTPFDPRAPGPPRYGVEIEKGRLGGSTQRAEGENFLLDWTENGFVLVERNSRAPHAAIPGTAAPGPLSASLGNRLSEAS